MKYALDHPTTSEALHKSDSSYQMKVAFFFYNRGQPIQKSFTGLLRSILYQIIKSAEETATTILPIYSELHHDPFKREWTITSLKKALKAVKTQNEIRLDICLFIDALDEYDGDDFEMAQFMADLTHESEFTNIKICLSSRPDPTFTGFFSKCLGLKIDDYTTPDISHYVRSNLTRAKNAMLSEMIETTILIIDRITEYIINHAHGVFLWVSIVVVDVTARLLNGDDPIEIEKTLLDIPTTDLDHRGNSKTSLDMLYQHILEERIPRSQCVQAYQMLEIARCGSSVPLECFSLFFDITNSPTEARVPEYAMEMFELFQKNNQRVQSRSDRMVLQLQSQCRGLLVLKTRANDSRKTQFVELLHGTLRDYLNIPKNLNFLFSTESKPTKNGYYYLMQGFLSLVEQRQLPRSYWWDPALLFGEWAQKAEKSMGALANPIVQYFGSKEPLMGYWNGCIEIRDYGLTGINTIEEFATVYNLYLFMKQRIQDGFQCPKITPDDKTPLLHHALGDNRALGLSEHTDPRVVKLLLEAGADPKEKRGIHFPLQLATFTNSGKIKNPNLEILELLLKFGAGANAEFKFRTGHQLSFLSSKSHPSQKRHKTYLLHIAVERQNIKMMDLLFDHGALPNLENLQQETPLFIACRSLLDKPGPTGSEMMNKLLDHGALFTAETGPLLEKLRGSLWYENRWHERKYRSESQSRLQHLPS